MSFFSSFFYTMTQFNKKFIEDSEFKQFQCCLNTRLEELGNEESTDLSLLSSNTNRLEEIDGSTYTYHRRQDVELLTNDEGNITRDVVFPQDNGKIFYCFLQGEGGSVFLNLPAITTEMIAGGMFVDVVIEGNPTTDSFVKSRIRCNDGEGFKLLGSSTNRDSFGDKVSNTILDTLIINDFIDLGGVQFRFVAHRNHGNEVYWLEVKKHVPPVYDYSATEKYTRENWVNGKKIYKRVITLPDWTVAGDEDGSIVLQTNGNLVDTFLGATFLLNSTGSSEIKTTLNYGSGANWQGGVQVAKQGNDQVLFWENMYVDNEIPTYGPFEVKVILEYTKA